MSTHEEHHGGDENLQEIESALTKTELFLEKNQKKISIIAGAVIAVVVIFLATNKFYLAPQEKEAAEQMFTAEQYFEKDSFNLALNGDGENLGFLDIIDEYGVTDASNLASYYAGISYLRMGQFEEAIDYLNDFETEDLLLAPVATGAMGDAYAELNNNDKALDLYIDAAEMTSNDLTSPIYLLKAGKLAERMGNTKKALELYESIKEEYPTTTEGYQVDKYIARVNVKK